jgi:hypothetical protein
MALFANSNSSPHMPVLSTPQASVVIEVTPGTATIPEDFIGANLTSPPPGLVTPITFNIDVVSDDLFETDETFEIRASSTSGISGSPVSIIISNDDSPPALVAPVLVEVFEGDIPGGGGATAVFPVKLSNISVGKHCVGWGALPCFARRPHGWVPFR